MNEVSGDRAYEAEPGRYALSGKIMLSAIIILFTVVILIIGLHIYARWFLARSHRRQQFLRNRRRSNRAHIIFTTTTNITTPSTAISHGLNPSVLKSLPTFIFTSKSNTQKEEEEQVLECAVCLSEFEENEMGRLLPKCNHSFHIGCIDMWFHSHSTCPLCRSPVEPINDSNNKIEIIIDSGDSSQQQYQEQPNNLETSSSGVLCSSCEKGSSSSSSSSSTSNENISVGSRRKVGMGVSIEVPRRNENLKSLEEEIQSSPRTPTFKSPGGRILSFRRMLSRERRPSTPTSTCSFPDLERGGEIEEQQIVHQPPNHQQQQQQQSSLGGSA
ncbi:hypothetical protein AQUCO_00300673v1 [Aquilegia coerulea]|uniref:RING-type E3 ubiquitin transferase n=1 Tax=Aquilegia coerulea TaxID=218851 RepID=A0A2G5EZU9_AQUCA|nr:hypothetical protein AQUCO_00300673v1 [Aquilegia coerulea]